MSEIVGAIFECLAKILSFIVTAAVRLILHVLRLTISWLRNQIKSLLAKYNTEKVAVGDLRTLSRTTENEISLDELSKLVKDGYTHLTAAIDKNGSIEKVELIKDTSDFADRDVNRLINRTGEGMVIVST